MTSKHSEADIAAVMVSWLVSLHYDVYQEVELYTQGPRADIVAKRGAELTIIETKTTPSLALLYQCMERRKFAHRVYAACPLTKRSEFQTLCEEIGIGLYSIRKGTDPKWDQDKVQELSPSHRWNSKPLSLAAKLRPEHKTSALAGAQTGGHWTPWKDTCTQLERTVQANPGIGMKEAVDLIRHHYRSKRSAISSLSEHILAGRLRIRFDNGALYPQAEGT